MQISELHQREEILDLSTESSGRESTWDCKRIRWIVECLDGQLYNSISEWLVDVCAPPSELIAFVAIADEAIELLNREGERGTGLTPALSSLLFSVIISGEVEKTSWIAGDRAREAVEGHSFEGRKLRPSIQLAKAHIVCEVRRTGDEPLGREPSQWFVELRL